MNTYHIIRYIKLSLFFFKKSLYFFFLCYCSSVKKRIAIFLFDEIELLDFAGPLEVFSSARLEKKKSANITNLPKAFEVFTVTEKKKTIHTSDGLKVFSNYNFLSCPNFNILILPGGIGTRSLIKNTVVINWIKKHKNIEFLASVCTGSLLLAKAKLLENRKATTHWGAYDLLHNISPSTKVIKNKRYVFDKYYTSSGVSAGIDMAFAILEKIHGKSIAKNTAKYMEYIRNH